MEHDRERKEVLRPQLVWIGKRCYRKPALKDNSHFNPEDEDFYDADQASDVTYCDEICDEGLDIEETNQGFRLKVPVASAYNKYIIGKKGETKKRLETETRTQIFVPKPGDREEVIVINGQDKKGIVSAKTRIDVLVDSARQRQPFTHFLSIPVTSDNIITGFENFKDDVLLQCDGDEGVDGSIFQTPQKLHLTLGTLVLLNKSEIDKASALLESSQEDLISSIIRGEPLTVQIQGLEYMNDDPGAVDVLYAKVRDGEAADRLQTLVDCLVGKFSLSGLMQQEHERVKLHVTVMNTLFRKDPSDTESHQAVRGQRKARESFDARGVLKNFKDYDFGSLTIPSIHLSQRFSTGQDQYYECVCSAVLSNP
ncbi:hypothetical protein RRG08_055228 [Elysia crispata]|uniref:K Homology domain-containing protein n=1 Tax=Elysia crispata TaxID=231223 RepID=A0AAE1CMC1_9GAST|nr:hypothetical protein RRG08_055228 [Elysia crispata]